MIRAELLQENESLKAENSVQKARIDALELQLAQLIKLVNGFKSERFVASSLDIHQPTLFNLETQTIERPVPEEEITYTRSKKKHPGRNKLPEHLPVKEVIIEPEEPTDGLVKIGEEISETLEYTPASLVKRRTIRPKYAKSDGQGVLIAELPSRPIDKSIAETCLLAYILVSKYVDHLPLYRQIQMFNRDFGWQASQSTLCDWVNSCCVLLEPLYNMLKQKVLSSDYIQVDESPMKVLDKDKIKSAHQGYQWVYHDPLQRLVLFNYRKGRGQHGPKELLSGYKGYLQCDGYSVYDKIGTQEHITLVGCLVHARRKFYDALDNDPSRAKHALQIFTQVYRIENELKSIEDLEQKQNQRLEQIQPLLEELKNWIEQESLKVLPKSAIGKAMAYYLNQYHKLINVTRDARLELDNNLIENTIRPMALGRKNYLFAGSHKAAQNAAMLYSFFGSCKLINVNPREWMHFVLENIKEWNIQQLEKLLPHNFHKIKSM